MSRDKEYPSSKKIKIAARKACSIANNAVQKVKKAKFRRMIKRDITNKCQNTPRLNMKWFTTKLANNDLAIHAGAAVCASAVLSIFTGSFVVEAIRAGVTVLVTRTVGNAAMRKKYGSRRGEDNEYRHYNHPMSSLRRNKKTSMNEAMKLARKTKLQNVTQKKSLTDEAMKSAQETKL